MARWNLTLNLRPYWDIDHTDDDQVQKLGKTVAELLRKLQHPTFDEFDLEEQGRLADAFEYEVLDVDDFDMWLDELYDWADGVRVWVATA